MKKLLLFLFLLVALFGLSSLNTNTDSSTYLDFDDDTPVEIAKT